MPDNDKTYIQQTIAGLIAKLPASIDDIYALTLAQGASKINLALCLEELKQYIPQLEQCAAASPLVTRLVLKLLLIFRPEEVDRIVQLTNLENFADLQPQLQRNATVMLAERIQTEQQKYAFRYILDSMFHGDREVDLLDCVSIAGVEYIDDYLSKQNCEKYVLYLKECVKCSFPTEYIYREYKKLIEMLIRKQCCFLAAETAIEALDFGILESIFNYLSNPEEKLQFALLLSEHQERITFYLPPPYYELLNANHRSLFFKYNINRLNLITPKSVDEVLKRDEIYIEWSKCYNYLADFLQNALMNAGCGSDLLINSHLSHESVDVSVNQSYIGVDGGENVIKTGPRSYLPEGYQLLIKQVNGQIENGKCDISTSMAVASVGILNLWAGFSTDFDYIIRLMNSSDKHVRAGAVLAMGISASGTRAPDFDYLIKLLGPIFHPYYYYLSDGPIWQVYTSATAAPSVVSAAAATAIISVAPASQFEAARQEEETTPTDQGTQPAEQQSTQQGGFYQIAYPSTSQVNTYYCYFSNKQHSLLSKNDMVQEWANSKEAMAAFSIGLAYLMTNNTEVKQLLIHRLHYSSDYIVAEIPPLEKNPRCFACFALGLVAMGSCDIDAATVILRLIAGNSRSQRLLRFFPLCCIAIGLIFFQAAKGSNAYLVDKFIEGIMGVLQSVKRPDYTNEHLAVTCNEDNVYLAAYLQSVVTVFAYAGCADATALSATFSAFSQVLLGRVAAEEALEILKFDKTSYFKKNRNKEDLNQITAETGYPLMLPTSDRLIWPGDNLEPMTVLCCGLGALCCGDVVFRRVILQYAYQILQFSDIHARRAVPFMLALCAASTADAQVIQQLEKLAVHSDQTISANALLALGIVGCGTMNAYIGGVLRHVIESKFYSETIVDFVLLNAYIAFGLLYCGRGLMHIDTQNPKALGCLMALFMFAAPAASVMTRPKCSMAYYLLAPCLQPKCVSFLNSHMEQVACKARVGKVAEDFYSENGRKLSGFSIHDAPVVRGVGQELYIVEGGKAIWERSYCIVVQQEDAADKPEPTTKTERTLYE